MNQKTVYIWQLQPIKHPILPSPGYNGNYIFFLSLYFSPRHVFGTFLHEWIVNLLNKGNFTAQIWEIIKALQFL